MVYTWSVLNWRVVWRGVGTARCTATNVVEFRTENDGFHTKHDRSYAKRWWNQSHTRMNFVLKMMEFIFTMMDFIFTMMDFIFTMMEHLRAIRVCSWTLKPSQRCKARAKDRWNLCSNEGFSFKNDEFCIKRLGIWGAGDHNAVRFERIFDWKCGILPEKFNDDCLLMTLIVLRSCIKHFAKVRGSAGEHGGAAPRTDQVRLREQLDSVGPRGARAGLVYPAAGDVVPDVWRCGGLYTKDEWTLH